MPENQNHYAILLCGGFGTRFWPLSRRSRPKQFTKFASLSMSCFEQTLERLDGLIPPKNRVVVTNQDQQQILEERYADQIGHLLVEPESRSTLAAVSLAVQYISQQTQDPKTPFLSLHCDHFVPDFQPLKEAFHLALSRVTGSETILFGVVPRKPTSAFGYIQKGEGREAPFYPVTSFKEKPSLDVAADYVESGEYLWNTGYFATSVGNFLDEISLHAPDFGKKLQDLGQIEVKAPEKLEAFYASLEKISIDHALLEKTRRIVVLEMDLEWHDIGSWESLSEAFPVDGEGNQLFGQGLLLDSKDVTVHNNQDSGRAPFVATVGLSEVVVVVEGDAILVCAKKDAQKVGNLVELLKEKRPDLLK